MAKLVVISGELKGREFALDGEVLIGRSEECDVTLPQARVSRRHARVLVCADGCFIEDLQTPNGTFVNGRRISRARLSAGDRIAFGDCELTFVEGGGFTPGVPDLGPEETEATVLSTMDVRRPPTDAGEPEDSTTLRKLKSHLKVVQEVAESACGALEIEELTKRILEQLLRVFPQAEHAHATLLGLGESGKDLRLCESRSGQASVGISRTLLKIATTEGRAVLARDVESDSRLSGAVSIVGQNLRSIMCSPLLTGDRALGAIQVDTASAGHPFSMDDLHLLAAVAGPVAIAAENARLHQELVVQQRLAAVGQTIASLAHCIKNVINGLKGGAYILDLGVRRQDTEKTSKGWEMVKRNTDFMFELVKDMLAYCRKENLSREPTDIGKLLSDTVLMVQESAAQRDVETSLTVEGEVPECNIDPTAMKRVVLNLLTNAVEACPDGGRVRVIAAMDEANEQCRISVEDNGQGIPEDVREHLFEPLFTTKGSRGTGLGLALVKKAVEEHKGRVEVESEVGKGTAFHIYIPMSVHEARAARTP